MTTKQQQQQQWTTRTGSWWSTTKTTLLVLLVGFVVQNLPHACALSSSPAAEQARLILSQALSSPSAKKLTYSPELVIPEPLDWTSIALQTNAIQALSTQLRQAKANVLFVQPAAVTALQTMATEQASVLGNFPGPVPLVYCLAEPAAYEDSTQEALQSQLTEIATAGATGILVPITDWSTPGGAWQTLCQTALDCGLQPIPELLVSQDTSTTTGVASWMDQVCSTLGFDPVAVVLTRQTKDDDDGDESDAMEEDEMVSTLSVSTLPYETSNDDNNNDQEEASSRKAPIKTRIPILGSIQIPVGEGRLQAESNRLQQTAGYFCGALLRNSCLPRGLQLDDNNSKNSLQILELLGPFWASCLNDLKSTKSKSFSFRAKNHMEKSVATEWGNYQKSVMESGALGDPNESYSVVDEAAGEYKGFA